MYIYVYMYIYLDIQICMYIYLHVYIYAFSTHTYIYICTYTYMYKTYLFILVYLCVYVCVDSLQSSRRRVTLATQPAKLAFSKNVATHFPVPMHTLALSHTCHHTYKYTRIRTPERALPHALLLALCARVRCLTFSMPTWNCMVASRVVSNLRDLPLRSELKDVIVLAVAVEMFGMTCCHVHMYKE